MKLFSKEDLTHVTQNHPKDRGCFMDWLREPWLNIIIVFAKGTAQLYKQFFSARLC